MSKVFFLGITVENKETEQCEDWFLHRDGQFTQNLNEVWLFSDQEDIKKLGRELIISYAIESGYPVDRLHFIGRLSKTDKRGYCFWETISSTHIVLQDLENGKLKLVRG